jgi:hypothetical protein
MSTTTGSITETARSFFDACETGQGWAACSAYCRPDATFDAQAEPLAEMRTLEQYTEWMKAMSALMDFDGGKISHMTKVWNSRWALKDLGWTE